MADADLPLDGGAAPPTIPSAAIALPSPVAGEPPPPAEAAVMPLFDHLAELRRRIAICLLAVAVGTVAGFAFGQQIIEVLKAPYGDAPLLLLAPGEGFFISLKISIVVGIVLAMPIILFQLWRFVSPGLTTDERRIARPWVPLALRLLRGRRRRRLLRPALRDRLPLELRDRRPPARERLDRRGLLRLRGHDVPRASGS